MNNDTIEECLYTCNICDGKGYEPPHIDNPQIMQSTCWKCMGEGKVDWITLAMNNPPEPPIDSSASYDFGLSGFTRIGPNGIKGFNGTSGIHDDAIDAMAQSLAQKIDEEILDAIMKGGNKNQIQNE